MKKIKLLMPIIGLTTITSSMLPLVSCKKNNKDELQEKWHKAFASIKNPWDKNKDFTVEGVVSGLDETKDQKFTAKCKGAYIEGSWEEIDKSVPDIYYNVLKDDTILWELHYNDVPEPCLSLLSNAAIYFVSFGSLFDSLYEEGVTKIDNLKYQADLYNADNQKLYCIFTFDDQFRIQNIDAKLVNTQKQKEEVLAQATANFKDYGSTIIDTTKIDGEYKKAGIETSIVTATKSDNKYVAQFAQRGGSQANFFMPQDLSINNLNTIKVTQGDYLHNEALYLNGNILIEGDDYLVVEKKSKEKPYPKIIKLNNALKPNDKLIVTGYPDSSSPLALELTNS